MLTNSSMSRVCQRTQYWVHTWQAKKVSWEAFRSVFTKPLLVKTWVIGDQLCSTDNPRKTALCDSPFGDRYETFVFGEMKLQKELDLMFVCPSGIG